MKRLSRQQVMRLHTMLIHETGGSDGLRDEGLLDSALHHV
jgi:death-on-curing protein